jgi:hypothetical protein
MVRINEQPRMSTKFRTPHDPLEGTERECGIIKSNVSLLHTCGNKPWEGFKHLLGESKFNYTEKNPLISGKIPKRFNCKMDRVWSNLPLY